MNSRRGEAFTLIEVLVVIALIGLLVATLVVPAVRTMEDKPQSAEKVFWNAVMKTRKQALNSASEVQLSFAPKKLEQSAEFIAVAADGSVTHFPYEREGELQADFLSSQKGRSLSLIGGVAVEGNALKKVTFFGDGTCTPFRLQIRTGGAARTLSIDPWTCAPILSGTEREGAF